MTTTSARPSTDLASLLQSAGIQIKSAGEREITGKCPVHVRVTGREDRSPSWSINAESGLWICFSCGARGTLTMLMAELRALLQLLETLHIRLEPRYIRSELNPADEFSRLTDRDAWSLKPHVQRMLQRKVERLVRRRISLDPFACHQSKVCLRYASRLYDPAALGFDGCALDWRNEAVWLNPPWALLPDIIGKLIFERPVGVLIVPVWPTQIWWPRLRHLCAVHLDLPVPKFSVQALHARKVEPFLHPGLRLRAIVLQPGMQR